ncbi:MAG: hypothetical protein ABID45_03980 [Patescibacteria group bacterium]
MARLKFLIKIVIIIFLVFSFCNINSVQAANKVKTFVKAINVKGKETSVSITKTTGDGMLLAGTTKTPGTLEDTDIFVSKVDSTGNNVWTKIIEPANFSEDELRAVIITSDTGYLIAGYTTFWHTSGEKMLLTKLDGNGNQQWSVLLGDGSLNRPVALENTSDGGYILLAENRMPDEGDAHDLVIIKLDSSGNKEWAKNLGDSGGHSNYGVQQTKDNGYILTAYADIINYANSVNSFSSVIKLDSSGNKEWGKAIERIPRDLNGDDFRMSAGTIYDVIQTKDEGFLLTGQIYTCLLTDLGVDAFSTYDLFVTKLNKKGEHQWTETFDFGRMEKGTSIHKASDNGYVIVGDREAEGFIKNDIIAIKISGSGGYKWSKILGGDKDTENGALAKMTDSSYAIIGEYMEDYDYKVAIFKLNSRGNIYDDCDYVESGNPNVTDHTQYVLLSDAQPTVNSHNLTIQRYLSGVTAHSVNSRVFCQGGESIGTKMAERLQGYFALQVESNGEAWYVYPGNLKRYYLGRAKDALKIMKNLSTGVTHEYITSHTVFPDNVSGRILLDTEDKGKAYYIYPKDKKAYYLGKKKKAYKVMRSLAMGISNNNLNKISPYREKIKTTHPDPAKLKTWVYINYQKAETIEPSIGKSSTVNKELKPVLKKVFKKVKLEDEMEGAMLTYLTNKIIKKKHVVKLKKRLIKKGYRAIDVEDDQITMCKGDLTLTISFNLKNYTRAAISVTF